MQTDWESDEEYERLPSIQTREQGHTLRRRTYTPETRTHNVHKHTNTCAQRAGLSKCRLNVLSGIFFSKRQAAALSAAFMCGWLWISSTGVTGHKHVIHSYDQTDNKDDISYHFFPSDSNVCFARTCIRTEEKRKEKQHPKPGLIKKWWQITDHEHHLL